jgi:acid phosphatase type 7
MLRRLSGIIILVAIATVMILLRTDPVKAQGDPVLVGAGDIGNCKTSGDELTAKLLDNIPGVVFTAGDVVYQNGTEEEFIQCYEPTWGRHKARTRPAIGNHEYGVRGVVPYYYTYFGENAGPASKGYYSYNLGSWHIIVLNTNAIRGLAAEQTAWLKQDLVNNPAQCTLAIAHHPVFSSGAGGVTRYSKGYFKMLYDAGADVFISGDAHDYERFAPQNPRGKLEPERGIRQFVVGTGGTSLNLFGRTWRNSEMRDNSTWGVLKLTLHQGSYTWEFIPVEGGTFTDSGSAPCVSLPAPIPTAQP